MTGAIGLVEPGVGTALPSDTTWTSFQAALDSYRASIGISTSANVISVAGGGQEYPTPSSPTAFNPAGERSLDVGVVTAINPQSTLVVYAGSGTANGAHGNGFTAYQSAFWDTINNPAVITSSFNYASLSAPGSPFLIASNGLYVDAALRNISTSAMADATVTVHTGTDSTDASSVAHAAFAWTSQLAQQSLQADFDPALLALFDGQTQGTLTQAIVSDGDSLSVTFNGNSTLAAQANLSAAFGFADFYAGGGDSVRLAQSVSVAETANGADDVNVVVRMRQVAGADLSLMLYKVDDYNGTIGGVAPGQAGYAALATGNAYTVQGGGTTIAGPGDGNAGQAQITGVDAGDLIAMQLTNVTNGDTFWAFSQANEVPAIGCERERLRHDAEELAGEHRRQPEFRPAPGHRPGIRRRPDRDELGRLHRRDRPAGRPYQRQARGHGLPDHRQHRAPAALRDCGQAARPSGRDLHGRRTSGAASEGVRRIVDPTGDGSAGAGAGGRRQQVHRPRAGDQPSHRRDPPRPCDAEAGRLLDARTDPPGPEALRPGTGRTVALDRRPHACLRARPEARRRCPLCARLRCLLADAAGTRGGQRRRSRGAAATLFPGLRQFLPVRRAEGRAATLSRRAMDLALGRDEARGLGGDGADRRARAPFPDLRPADAAMVGLRRHAGRGAETRLADPSLCREQAPARDTAGPARRRPQGGDPPLRHVRPHAGPGARSRLQGPAGECEDRPRLRRAERRLSRRARTRAPGGADAARRFRPRAPDVGQRLAAHRHRPQPRHDLSDHSEDVRGLGA
ncbi:hypothetical protein OSTOST_12270 [Ostertagia ostertagi]